MATSQKLFKKAYEEQLRSDIVEGDGLQSYYDNFKASDPNLLVSDIIPATNIPTLNLENESENSISLHQYLPSLNETQASDKRLWAYLAHVDFRDYVSKRWPPPYSAKEISEDQDKKNKTISSILDHWFIRNENDRSLRRHALARLWWAAHLTMSPWEKDPEYFGHLKNKDPYLYTPVLFINENLYSEILERHFGRFNRVLITILEFIRKNPEFAERKYYRPFSKELTLQSGFRRISLLSYADLYSLIEDIASDVKDRESLSSDNG